MIRDSGRLYLTSGVLHERKITLMKTKYWITFYILVLQYISWELSLESINSQDFVFKRFRNV